MKVYNNVSHPLKIRKINTDFENINVWSYKNVFYNTSVNVNSLSNDRTSSIQFINPILTKIPSLIINSGDLLLIDKDCIIMDTVTISSGGEMRII